MYPSIATTVLPRIEESIWFKFVLAFAGSVLLAVSAKVQIPFWPVPMTMQTFVVLVIGMAYGARLGAATVGLYLAQGAMAFRFLPPAADWDIWWDRPEDILQDFSWLPMPLGTWPASVGTGQWPKHWLPCLPEPC